MQHPSWACIPNKKPHRLWWVGVLSIVQSNFVLQKQTSSDGQDLAQSLVSTTSAKDSHDPASNDCPGESDKSSSADLKLSSQSGVDDKKKVDCSNRMICHENVSNDNEKVCEFCEFYQTRMFSFGSSLRQKLVSGLRTLPKCSMWSIAKRFHPIFRHQRIQVLPEWNVTTEHLS